MLGDHRRLDRAARASSLAGRVLRGRPFNSSGMLGRLPGPMSAWSGARDVPVPAAETFRDWWDRTDGGRAGEEGR